MSATGPLSADRDPWVDDAQFTGEDWRLEVANHETRRGYLDWVDAKREEAADQKWQTLRAESDAEGEE